MSYERGEVVLVVYRPPTTGPRREGKSRPMIVISSDTYHSERPQDILARLVTTKVAKYRGHTDYLLQDWEEAGLHQPSLVRATLATVEFQQIGGKVGRLTVRDLQGVEVALRQALAL